MQLEHEPNAGRGGHPPGQAGDHASSWLVAARAAEAKKARQIRVLDLRGIASFVDYFVICSGLNSPQIQAISEEISRRLRDIGEYPVSVEGYANAEWILADYGDCLVHIFSEKARAYYDLDRLWRHAKEIPIPPATDSVE
ncbi:MAG TPA: ribosome silencing factor [Bryobacteraceae bacterium]|nr:ribosome silencing factor [Bryobacteraceae bacterium]